ncbi:MAG: Fic family protein [Alphaproteobacteria bacterium]|nr:Fic family protein [Alphaproteobacteria bacterium]
MDTENLPEIFLSEKNISYKITRLVKQGIVRKIAGKLYTSNMQDDLEKIVSRRLWEIVGLLFPKAIIADRTAFDLKPTAHKEIFVISGKQRPVTVGEYTIYPRSGAPVQESDTPFMENLYLPSTARKFLESMRISRRKKSIENRYLSQTELEEKLDAFIRINGEDGVNKLRDQMRGLAPALDLKDEFEKINALIGALLHTHTSVLLSPAGKARSSGKAFDPDRAVLFSSLYDALTARAPVFRKTTENGNSVLCFYEAYFSNYIEGTKFPIEDAMEIVFENKIPEHRPEDAHDIAGTYGVLSDMREMSKTPKNEDDLFELLKTRHKKIMIGRPNKNPGRFKQKRNQAGSTVFVDPGLIEGTLQNGFKLYRKLDNAFSRAVFMMFLISEVHPFDDGNGRLSRIMMNAELIADNEQRIIIPTVYRSNYLMALKGLSHNGITDAFIKTLDFAQKYTKAINWGNLQQAGNMLKATNAFIENGDDDTAVLKMPAGV